MTLTADPTPENEPETPREAEDRHLAEAERLLSILAAAKSPAHAEVLTAMAARASVHASLAIYYRDLPEVRVYPTQKKD